VKPTELHQRTPPYIRSKSEIDVTRQALKAKVAALTG
jgi:fructose-1,6-bisphosphatase